MGFTQEDIEEVANKVEMRLSNILGTEGTDRLQIYFDYVKDIMEMYPDATLEELCNKVEQDQIKRINDKFKEMVELAKGREIDILDGKNVEEVSLEEKWQFIEKVQKLSNQKELIEKENLESKGNKSINKLTNNDIEL